MISPCLCNVYLHRLDRQWEAHGTGLLVRFADDLLVLCHNRREAEDALRALRLILAEMGLELKPAKTRIVHLKEGGEGLDFLGFHHRRVRGERGYEHLRFLARWPSREAMQRARDRVRELTDRKRTPVQHVDLEIEHREPDHIAGRTWTTVSRQFENSSLTPSKSIAKAPTTNARGASPASRSADAQNCFLHLGFVTLFDCADKPPDAVEHNNTARGRCSAA